jgi:hypothetical protein
MSRGRFKCSDKTCKAVFTVTSGTVFASRKLSFKKTLIAIWFSVNSAKGKEAGQRQCWQPVPYHYPRATSAMKRAAATPRPPKERRSPIIPTGRMHSAIVRLSSAAYSPDDDLPECWIVVDESKPLREFGCALRHI